MDDKISRQIQLFELNEFYDRWNTKCNSYNNQTLSDLFDKFFSLFVIYNRLYNEVTALFEENGTLDQMREEGIIDKKPKRVRDNKAATVCVAKYLHDTSPTVMEFLNEEITSFKKIIKEGSFNIVLFNGIPQKKKDIALFKNLEAYDEYLRLYGIVSIIYNLRCNLFHGQKEFNEIQKQVLVPANSALEKINKALLKAIKNTLNAN